MTILMFAILLLLSKPSLAAMAVVQPVTAQGSGVSSITTAPITTSGTLFVCDIDYTDGNELTSSVTDSIGNKYVSQPISSADSGGRAQKRYVANGKAGAAHTFTLTLSGNADLAIACLEALP